MKKDDDIVRLPPTDKWMGSCPECGKNIWASYFFAYDQKNNESVKEVYRCFHCKTFVVKEDIIPFRPLQL